MLTETLSIPKLIAKSILINRSLIKKLLIRDISSRYRGSLLGILWPIINPIFMLAVYTFVFSIVFQARWGQDLGNSKFEFALILFAGLIIFNFFAESILNASTLITSNTSYVKKVIFPLEVLTYVNVLSGLFNFALALVVLLIAHFILRGIPELTVILLPVILIPLMLITLGLTLLLASLGVYIRDIKHLLGPLMTALLFLSPIFYPKSALPPTFQTVMGFNPLTYPIEFFRAAIFATSFPTKNEILGYWLASIVIVLVGFVWFQKTRKGFADVL